MTDLRLVHIRCGSDIRAGLAAANVPGCFLEFSDPYTVGPVAPVFDTDTINERSGWLRARFGLKNGEGPDLALQYSALEALGASDHCVLWFEHDPYDLLSLAYILSRVAAKDGPKPGRLEIVHIDHHPNHPRFIGLGQLSPSELRALWDTNRSAVQGALVELGQMIWGYVATDNLAALADLAAAGTPDLPSAPRAIARYLADRPHIGSGLSLTEGLALHCVDARGEATGGQIFGQLIRSEDPLPYLGDLMFWPVLADLSKGPEPLLDRTPGPSGGPASATYRLTAAGQNCLSGRAIWPRSAGWRFDPFYGRMVHR